MVSNGMSELDLCAIPAIAAPDGQLSNLVNPNSLATTTIVVEVLTTVWALAFVAARAVVNWRRLTWSDYFMALGMTFGIAQTAVSISQSRYARHSWDLPACWLDATFAKINFAYIYLAGSALYCSKSSIFLLYRQLFSVKRSIKIAVSIGLVTTFLAYFPNLPLSIRYLCPLGGQSWKDVVTSPEPQKFIYWAIVQGCMAVSVDIYIFVLPLPTLATLNMTLKTRVQLIAVFAIASMGVVASVVALVYRVKLLGRSDPNWQQAAVYIANVVENNVAIIVGSTPAVATFVRVYVSESALINTLRSKIRRVSGSSSGGNSGPPYPGPGSDLATFGSPNAHVQGPEGHELTDPTVTAAKIGPDDHYLSYRNHAAGYQQPHAQPSSTERLV